MPANPAKEPRLGPLNRQARLALLIKLLAAVTSYGFSVLAARIMGAGGFGQVAVFLSVSLFLSVVGAKGQQMAALRFVPPLAGAQNNLASVFVFWALGRVCRSTLTLFFVTLAVLLVTSHYGWPTGFSATTLVLGMSLVPLVGLVDFLSHVARGFHLLPLSLIPKEILWRATAGLLIGTLYLGQGSVALEAETVLMTLVLTLGLIAIGQWISLMRNTGISFRRIKEIDVDAQWENAAVPFWISSVSNVFLANADTITVGLLVGPEAAGFYFAANRLAILLSFFQTSHNVVLGPLLAASWQLDKPWETAAMVRNAAVRMTIPTLLLGIVLAVFAPLALSVFGTEFAQAATPLRLLILAAVINAALGPGDITLNMCGFHRLAMVASAALLLVSAPLLVGGAIIGGSAGVAFAVLVATVIRKVVFWGLTLRQMSMRSDALARGPIRTIGSQAHQP